MINRISKKMFFIKYQVNPVILSKKNFQYNELILPHRGLPRPALKS